MALARKIVSAQRINRVEFLKTVVFSKMLYYPILFLFIFLGLEDSGFLLWIWAVSLVPLVTASYCRLHDCDYSGAWLALYPIVFFALFFVPGTDGENRFD